MDRNKTIVAFSRLGEILALYSGKQGNNGIAGEDLKAFLAGIDEACINASAKNPWFILPHIKSALSAWAGILTEQGIRAWLEDYEKGVERPHSARTVGVVMAGNIPIVGFHDFFCVLMSGHNFLGRLSSQDEVLMPFLAEVLVQLEPGLGPRISFTSGKLTGFDAVIATGSNNTSRYFEYYFGKYPHIIRKNRNGIAVLTGNESPEDLAGLADDIFLYFGLGCRNVSKIYIPEGLSLDRLKEAFTKYREYREINKYRNNYDYYKSIFLVNGEPYYDCGNLLLKEDNRIASPVSVLYYETYSDLPGLYRSLEQLSDQIQCISSVDSPPFRGCRPGQTQQPGLGDYADGVDTMSFLLGLD